jgi:hypothetical protein
MPRLVEDVGEPLRAGWVARVVREMGLESDTLSVGNREVVWELGYDAVTVTHARADGRRASVCYAIGLVYTDLPSGGARWWWSCPTCWRRVGTLYLPDGRERLACRKCCGLYYRSQYTGRKRRRRRCSVVVTRERLLWAPATGWVVSRRKARQ